MAQPGGRRLRTRAPQGRDSLTPRSSLQQSRASKERPGLDTFLPTALCVLGPAGSWHTFINPSLAEEAQRTLIRQSP